MSVWATNVPLNTGPFWKIYGKGAARINQTLRNSAQCVAPKMLRKPIDDLPSRYN
ncbi:MAG TPA: hypothetical protein VFD48_11235 [Pyrinomonadaceae bacterium]|nr:hypothetical protein [Pyrinomonadaceae bacterium]